MDTPIIEKVVDQLRTLPDELQMRVLEFMRTLKPHAPHGVPGKQLLRFAGAIPPKDVQRMREAIEQECERIDADEW